ncbi:MAG: preprotein translocase subunit SecE [Desulfotomaculales bacterium]
MAVMKKTEQTKKPPAKTSREKPVAKPQRAKRRFDFSGFKRAREFFQGVQQELKKVHWLRRRETLIYTAVVLVSVVVVGLIIWIADSILSRLVQLILT